MESKLLKVLHEFGLHKQHSFSGENVDIYLSLNKSWFEELKKEIHQWTYPTVYTPSEYKPNDHFTYQIMGIRFIVNNTGRVDNSLINDTRDFYQFVYDNHLK